MRLVFYKPYARYYQMATDLLKTGKLIVVYTSTLFVFILTDNVF